MKKYLCFLLCFVIVFCAGCGKVEKSEEVVRENLEITQEKIIIGENVKKGDSVKVPILLFHHFSESSNDSSVIKVSNFELHIKTLLENGYNTVTVTDLWNYVYNGVKLPKNPICITFDDGYLSNYEIAFPILQKYNAKATIFVIGSSVGKKKYKETDYGIIEHFTWEQANEMINSGLVDIQSHTWDMHQWYEFEEKDKSEIRVNMLRLNNETDEEYINYLKNDCQNMNKVFQENLGYIPKAIAYPGGKYDNFVEKNVVDCGIDITLNTFEDVSTIVSGEKESLIGLNRINVDNNMTSKKLLNFLKSCLMK